MFYYLFEPTYCNFTLVQPHKTDIAGFNNHFVQNKIAPKINNNVKKILRCFHNFIKRCKFFNIISLTQSYQKSDKKFHVEGGV